MVLRCPEQLPSEIGSMSAAPQSGNSFPSIQAEKVNIGGATAALVAGTLDRSLPVIPQLRRDYGLTTVQSIAAIRAAQSLRGAR